MKVNCLNKLRITLKGVMREVLKDAYSAQQREELLKHYLSKSFSYRVDIRFVTDQLGQGNTDCICTRRAS